MLLKAPRGQSTANILASLLHLLHRLYGTNGTASVAGIGAARTITKAAFGEEQLLPARLIELCQKETADGCKYQISRCVGSVSLTVLSIVTVEPVALPIAARKVGVITVSALTLPDGIARTTVRTAHRISAARLVNWSTQEVSHCNSLKQTKKRPAGIRWRFRTTIGIETVSPCWAE